MFEPYARTFNSVFRLLFRSHHIFSKFNNQPNKFQQNSSVNSLPSKLLTFDQPLRVFFSNSMSFGNPPFSSLFPLVSHPSFFLNVLHIIFSQFALFPPQNFFASFPPNRHFQFPTVLLIFFSQSNPKNFKRP